LYRVIDHLMLELVKAIVGLQSIGVQRGPGLNMLANFSLNRALLGPMAQDVEKKAPGAVKKIAAHRTILVGV
jgi:hypothetical protein